MFLNEELIAKSSIWQYQSSGYIAEQIYRKILNTQHKSHTGYSMISFVAGVFTLASETKIGCVNHNRIQYQIVFSIGDRLTDDKNLSDAKQGIFALRDFVCELENQLRPNRSENDWGEDKRECETLLGNSIHKSRNPGIDDMYVR